MPESRTTHEQALILSREERSYRVLHTSLITMGCVCLFFAFRAWQSDILIRILSLLTGAGACFIALYLLKQQVSTKIVAHVAMTGVMVAASFSFYSSGGLMGSGVGWIFILAATSGLIGGRQVGMVWFIYAAVLLIGSAFYEYRFGAPLDLTPIELQFWQNRSLLFGQLILMAIITVAFLRHTAEADRIAEDHIHQLDREVAVREAAQQEALRANKAKSEFLASMSHELRTPLNSIIGFSSHLIRHSEDPPDDRPAVLERRAAALDCIHNNGQMLLHLINELLDLSKLESGALEMVRSRISLNDLLESCVKDMQGMALEHKLDLNFQSCEQSISINADGSRLRQVVSNLISNALKYTEKGGATVYCSITEEDIIFGVKDTGVGIDPDDLDNLFDVYNNLSRRVQKPVQSTGLGLSLCAKLVERHGGRIEVESEPSKGSDFKVIFPAETMLINPAGQRLGLEESEKSKA
ncbi:MAG: sensor histidine kinase [Cellvibrionaceae bacterium]